MALRCKGGDGEVLNFPKSDYATLMPSIDRLSRVRGHGKGRCSTAERGGDVRCRGGCVHRSAYAAPQI